MGRLWPVALVAVVVALSGCASSPGALVAGSKPAATPTARRTLSPTPDPAARARYIAIVIPLNKAIANENAAGDDSWQEFVYYAPATRDAYLAAVKAFGAPSSWPREVRTAVGKLEAALIASAKTMDNISHATSDTEVNKEVGSSRGPIDARGKQSHIIQTALGITDENDQLQ